MGRITLDLPFPPSTNHIWRRSARRVYRSAKYLDWMDRADGVVMAGRQYPRQKIHGPFQAAIFLSKKSGHGDLDNRIKAVLDWAQSRDVIVNDKDCHMLIVQWVDHQWAPEGCRLVLEKLEEKYEGDPLDRGSS